MRRVRQKLSEPQHCGVGGIANFLENRIKTWEILGSREAIILDLNSVLFYECGNVNVYEF